MFEIVGVLAKTDRITREASQLLIVKGIVRWNKLLSDQMNRKGQRIIAIVRINTPKEIRVSFRGVLFVVRFGSSLFVAILLFVVDSVK